MSDHRTPGPNSAIPAHVRRAVFARANDKCEQCGGVDGLAPHHIKRLRDHGTHDPENIEVLCKPCHQARHRGTNGYRTVDPKKRRDEKAFTYLSEEERVLLTLLTEKRGSSEAAILREGLLLLAGQEGLK